MSRFKRVLVCTHLARDHPLPDGNKRVAYLALLDEARANAEETLALHVEGMQEVGRPLRRRLA